jgi:hypothetical protein
MSNLSEMQKIYELRHEAIQLVFRLQAVHDQLTVELAAADDSQTELIWNRQCRIGSILMKAYKRHERRMNATYRFFI